MLFFAPIVFVLSFFDYPFHLPDLLQPACFPSCLFALIVASIFSVRWVSWCERSAALLTHGQHHTLAQLWQMPLGTAVELSPRGGSRAPRFRRYGLSFPFPLGAPFPLPRALSFPLPFPFPFPNLALQAAGAPFHISRGPALQAGSPLMMSVSPHL